jgi:hypothetical protein
VHPAADGDGNGDGERVPLPGDDLEEFFWSYDNDGSRIAQLRFYDVETDVN